MEKHLLMKAPPFMNKTLFLFSLLGLVWNVAHAGEQTRQCPIRKFLSTPQQKEHQQKKSFFCCSTRIWEKIAFGVDETRKAYQKTEAGYYPHPANR